LSDIRVGYTMKFSRRATRLGGVDARSTYCYLLAAAESRKTRGFHLLEAMEQGLHPEIRLLMQPRAEGGHKPL